MPRRHTVQQGECISSIAERYGHFPDKLWKASENAELRKQREDMNVLQPGDIVVIPDKERHQESAATEQTHRFRRKGVPSYLRVRVLIDDEPVANKPWVLHLPSDKQEGRTDGDGMVEAPIPPGVRKATLVVDEGDEQQVYELEIGSIDPVDNESGVKARLEGLGYTVDELGEAIAAFQEKEGLEVTGEMNDETRDALTEEFGS